MPLVMLRWTPKGPPEEPAPRAPVRAEAAAIVLLLASLAFFWFVGVLIMVSMHFG